MYDVMDLCISCKGCKTECPSQVDMAKFKSEFLYHYQNEHGFSLRSRLFAHIGTISRWGSPFSSLINRLNETLLMKKGFDWIGISSKQPLPKLTKQRFSSWFATISQAPHLAKKVVLFNDTFTEFYHPEIGKAAVQLLNWLGYHVTISTWSCCGRPAFSKGLLPYAKQQAESLIEKLTQLLEKEIPIIGLEPSCLLTLRDDYQGLIEKSLHKKLTTLLPRCLTLDEFLAQEIVRKGFKFPDKGIKRIIHVHGHCYQKALVGMRPTLEVLKAIPNIEVREIHSGCCGMAGSFGYESEHQEISKAMGNLVLFPAIEKCSADDWIIAGGTSCREQIGLHTNRRALHLTEALIMLFDH